MNGCAGMGQTRTVVVGMEVTETMRSVPNLHLEVPTVKGEVLSMVMLRFMPARPKAG